MKYNMKATIKTSAQLSNRRIVASTYTNILKLFDTNIFYNKSYSTR